MRQTQPINHTRNPNWHYTPSGKTNIAATFRRVQREYEQAWDDAHAEDAERDKATQNVQPMRKKVGAK